MKELQELREDIQNLTGIVNGHINETRIYRQERDLTINQHSKELWGNGKPGLKTKVDRLEFSEKIRTWVLGVVGTAVIGIILNHFFT